MTTLALEETVDATVDGTGLGGLGFGFGIAWTWVDATVGGTGLDGAGLSGLAVDAGAPAGAIGGGVAFALAFADASAVGAFHFFALGFPSSAGGGSFVVFALASLAFPLLSCCVRLALFLFSSASQALTSAFFAFTAAFFASADYTLALAAAANLASSSLAN